MTPGTVATARPAAASRSASIARLSEKSVAKRFEAFRDVDWEDPENAIDTADPRFALPASDPLGATSWYRALRPELQGRIGLHLASHFLKLGIHFENALQRGLLEFTSTLHEGSPEFRYCYHEIAEEAQHSLMFSEFLNRAGLPVTGLPTWARWLSRAVVHCGRSFPELFFVFVLSGEEPIDHVQRELLKARHDLHPLLRRISQIHVIEEARHLSFARTLLEERVPRLSAPRRRLLELLSPVILGQMARLMLEPPPEIVRAYRIPQAVLDEAYRSVASHPSAIDAVSRPRRFLRELGLVPHRSVSLWRRMRIWPDGPIPS